jgi:hypothetical protein
MPALQIIKPPAKVTRSPAFKAGACPLLPSAVKNK